MKWNGEAVREVLGFIGNVAEKGTMASIVVDDKKALYDAQKCIVGCGESVTKPLGVCPACQEQAIMSLLKLSMGTGPKR